MPRRAWIWSLLLGVPVPPSTPWLPDGSLLSWICYAGLGVVPCVVMAVAIALLRPPHPRMWWLDLDFFKKFNDAYGHQAGDLLLKEAAAAWRAQLRDPDVLARYGGGGFGVGIAGLAAEEALAIVARLRPVTPRGQTFSAGLAEWDGHEPADALVRRADQALYLAKDAGRDRVLLAERVTLPG